MGNLFNIFGLKQWNTPGGTASAVCLDMLEKDNLYIEGRANFHRQQLRESLLYTLLYQSPLRANIVLLGKSFGAYADLPHIKGYYTKYDDIYGVLANIAELIDKRENQIDIPTLYVFIEDYAALCANDNLISLQITRIVKLGKNANIKVIIFSEQLESATTSLLPNVRIGSGGMITYEENLYNMPVTSPEECSKRVAWWTRQHKRSFIDKWNGISPSTIPTVKNMTGLQYETYVARKLRRKGFKRIKVTQASGDYGADILAFDNKGKKTCIQCKKYQGSVGVRAVQEIIAAKGYYNCQRAMVITTASFTPNAKELARSQGVELFEYFM